MKPPYNEEYEKFLLASILKGNLSPDTVEPDNFYSPRHQAIIRGMKNLLRKGEPIEVLSLSHELKSENIPVSELCALEDEHGFLGKTDYYLQEVKAAASVRKLQGILEQPEDPARTILDARKILEEPPTSSKWNILTPAEVLNFEKPRQLIEPFLYADTVNLLVGPAGKGKSLVTLSLLRSLVTGHHLWGRFRVVSPGPVILFDEETPRPFLADRYTKIGIGPDLPLSIIHFQGVQVDRPDHIEMILREVHKSKPVLVAFDSLIRFHRQPENDTTSMSRVMDAFRRIANVGTTVWILHHHKKGDAPIDQKARGATDIVAGVDIEFALTEKDGILTLASAKTRVEPFGPIRLRLEINGDQIRVVYQGTENESLQEEVEDVLRDHPRQMVSEIIESLSKRKVEVGVNKVRNILKDPHGRITATKEKTGKTYRVLYSLNGNEDAASGTTFYALPLSKERVKPLSVNPTLHGGSEISEVGREALTPDSQDFADAPRDKKEGDRKAINRSINASRAGVQNEGGAVKRKSDEYEVLPDGQITY